MKYQIRILIAIIVGIILLNFQVFQLFAQEASGVEETTQQVQSKTSTKSIMVDIYQIIQEIFPLSLDHAAFSSPKNRDLILSYLFQLNQDAYHMEEHFARDPIAKFMSQSLANDTKQAYHWFKQERPQETTFILRHLVENCVGCHAKHPSSEKGIHAGDFTAKINPNLISRNELANLQMATQQFDEAIRTYDKILSDENVLSSELFLNGSIIDIFKLTIQVKEDFPKTLQVIKTLKQRKDLTKFMENLLNGWQRDVEDSIILNPFQSISIEKAKSLLSKANEKMLFQSDQLGLIQYITVASILQHLLLTEKNPSMQAQAYYLLGYCQNLIHHSLWLNEGRYYLEAAIQSEPHSEIAEKAFNLLEENITLGFSGSQGTYVPKEIKVWLEKLQKLASIVRKAS